jgi:hypothetical protein
MISLAQYRRVLAANYTPEEIALIDLSESIARTAHVDDIRRGEYPYIEHPLEMAFKAARAGWPTLVVAACWLHDVREDHYDDGFDWDDLREQGVPDPLIELLFRVTHDKNIQTYDQYIDKVCGSYWACMLKVLDIGSNLSPQASAKQIKKVTGALLKLGAAIEEFEKKGYTPSA